MGEGASRYSFLFKAPYGTSAELCKLCGEGPSGKRGASGRQMDRRMDAWMDGWMDGRGRACPCGDVLPAHREEGQSLDPCLPLPSLDRKEPVFSARLFLDEEFRRLARRTDSHTDSAGSNPAAILRLAVLCLD